MVTAAAETPRMSPAMELSFKDYSLEAKRPPPPTDRAPPVPEIVPEPAPVRGSVDDDRVPRAAEAEEAAPAPRPGAAPARLVPDREISNTPPLSPPALPPLPPPSPPPTSRIA